VSSGIIPFLEGRDNAIKAWKMDGYIPLEEVQQEYGITADDLFHAELLLKKGYWRDLQCYPYKLSKQGRLLLSHDEQYDIILVKKGCLEKLFLAVKKQDIEKLADVMCSRHAKGGERRMNQQWSEEAQQTTRDMIKNQSYGIRDGKVYFKHIDGSFAYVGLEDLLACHYIVHVRNSGQVTGFDSIEALLHAGWVLD